MRSAAVGGLKHNAIYYIMIIIITTTEKGSL